MESWVRSQSKETLLKVSKVYICDEEIYATTESEFDERIGTYKTKERALEVLDGIQKYILLPNTDNSAYVYQMPEE